MLAPWFRQRSLAAIGKAFAGTGVCWGPYQTFAQMVAEDARCSTANPLFSTIDQPGIGTYLVPGSPLQFAAVPRETPRRAPVLGEHTDEVLGRRAGTVQGRSAGCAMPASWPVQWSS